MSRSNSCLGSVISSVMVSLSSLGHRTSLRVGCLIWSSCSVVGVVWMSCVSVAGVGG